MARITYDVPAAQGWSHIGGAAFQALIRMPRAHPLVKVIGTLADTANMDVVLATLEAAAGALPDPPAYAGVESAPKCRAVVRGPARVVLRGGERTETLECVEEEKLDQVVDWGVRQVRLEPADGSIVTEIDAPARRGPVDLTPEVMAKLGVQLPDEVLAGLALGGESEAVAVTDSAPDEQPAPSQPEAWAPPPPAAPDAWWLRELSHSAEERVAEDDQPSAGAEEAAEEPRVGPDAHATDGEHGRSVVPDTPHARPTPTARGRSRWLAPEPKPEPEPEPRDQPGISAPGAVDVASELPPQQQPTGRVNPSSTPKADAAAYLVLSSGAVLSLAGTVVLGRAPTVDGSPDPRRSAVRLAPRDSTVSRNHLRIERVDDEVVITDVGSKNGSFVFVPGSPGVALEAGESIVVELATNPLVVLGSTASAWITTHPPRLPDGETGE